MSNTMTYRRRFLTLFALTTATLASGAALFISRPSHAAPQQDAPPVAIDVPAPELVGGPWLNTPKNAPIKWASRRGKVTIVEFWTFGCINCQHNLPIYSRWQKRFAKKDITIIGVHTPETDSEKVPANVVRRVKQLGITYPILLDQKGTNWGRWGQQFWPTVYLIDKWGHVRYRWEGELEYENAGGEEKMARLVDELLKAKQ